MIYSRRRRLAPSSTLLYIGWGRHPFGGLILVIECQRPLDATEIKVSDLNHSVIDKQVLVGRSNVGINLYQKYIRDLIWTKINLITMSEMLGINMPSALCIRCIHIEEFSD